MRSCVGQLNFNTLLSFLLIKDLTTRGKDGHISLGRVASNRFHRIAGVKRVHSVPSNRRCATVGSTHGVVVGCSCHAKGPISALFGARGTHRYAFSGFSKCAVDDAKRRVLM